MLPQPPLRYAGFFVALLLLVCQASVFPAQASEDKLRELIRATGFVEIKLIEAHVPDMDPAPLQGKSDVFVKVYLNETNELICETPIEQDNNSPKVSAARVLLRNLSLASLNPSGVFFGSSRESLS